MNRTPKPGSSIFVEDSVLCIHEEGETKRTGLKATVLSRIDSVIGYIFLVENVEDKWVATAFFLRPDDVELTCPMVIHYGEAQVAKNRQQAINLLKGDPRVDDEDESPT